MRGEHLFTHARDALVLIDVASDRILRWNPAAEQLFGYTPALVIGHNVEVLMPPDVARVHRERMAVYRRSGDAEALSSRKPLGVAAVHSSGAAIRVELSISPVEAADAPARWALLTFRDARCQEQTERATLASARAEVAREELQKQLRDCAALLETTTREIAAPIARARRAAERLARSTCESDRQDSRRVALLAHVVAARTRRAERAIEEIHTLGAIQSGTFELHARPVNLVPLVGRVVAEFRGAAPLHRFKVGGPQGLTVVCDAARIEAVVRDLLARAVRRNPRGCWIDVDLRRPLAGVAQIVVRDYGRPLSAREQGRTEGTPRGEDRAWFIDGYVVERHGGAFEIEYPSEGGVRVGVRLPMRPGRLAT